MGTNFMATMLLNTIVYEKNNIGTIVVKDKFGDKISVFDWSGKYKCNLQEVLININVFC